MNTSNELKAIKTITTSCDYLKKIFILPFSRFFFFFNRSSWTTLKESRIKLYEDLHCQNHAFIKEIIISMVSLWLIFSNFIGMFREWIIEKKIEKLDFFD